MTNDLLLSPREAYDFARDGAVFVEMSHNMLRHESAPFRLQTFEEEWRRECLPDARLFHVMEHGSQMDAQLPFTLPSPESFSERASQLGLDSNTHLICYSRSAPFWATRLWFLLTYFGARRVSVLDGGFTAYARSGLPTEPGGLHRPATFTARQRTRLVSDKDRVLANLRNPEIAIVNTLAPNKFDGTSTHNLGRPGRIWGSINLPTSDLFDEEGLFRGHELFVERLAKAGAGSEVKEIISYCGGGLEASAVCFATELCTDLKWSLYDGSLNEWVRDDSLPMETGRPEWVSE